MLLSIGIDAFPIGKQIGHIITQLRADEWKTSRPGSSSDATAIKDTKIEKLNTLLRILKNTTEIDSYYPKKNMVAW